MFDLFAPSHLLLIAIAILLFVGPKDLPKFMHMVGKWTRKGRRLADEFRKGLDNMEQEGQLDELRKEIAALRSPSPSPSPSPSRSGVNTEISSEQAMQVPTVVAVDTEHSAMASF